MKFVKKANEKTEEKKNEIKEIFQINGHKQIL